MRFFLQAAGGEAGLSPATRIVSIGPVTSATLREHGLEPDVEADRHDIDGIIEALLADAAASGKRWPIALPPSSPSSPTTASSTSSSASATG